MILAGYSVKKNQDYSNEQYKNFYCKHPKPSRKVEYSSRENNNSNIVGENSWLHELVETAFWNNPIIPIITIAHIKNESINLPRGQISYSMYKMHQFIFRSSRFSSARYNTALKSIPYTHTHTIRVSAITILKSNYTRRGGVYSETRS